MIPTVEQITALLVGVVVPLVVGLLVYRKRSMKLPKSVDFQPMENSMIIENIQKEIVEIKQNITGSKLDMDQLNTRLSRLEGMFEILKSRSEK